MLTLHDLAPSINAYKVRLLLSFLQMPYEAVPVEVFKGAHKQPGYLARHPFGLVPVLEDEGSIVWDSHAILVYLAAKYGGETWGLGPPIEQAAITAWLSVAANEVHNSLFQARVTKLFSRDFGLTLEQLQKRSADFLATLERHLLTRRWLVLERPTIADVALYPGLAMAHEGGVDLTVYPAVKSWTARLESLPGYCDIAGGSGT